MKFEKVKTAAELLPYGVRVEFEKEGSSIRAVILSSHPQIRVEKSNGYSEDLKILVAVDGTNETRWRVRGEKLMAGVPVIAAQLFLTKADTREFARDLEDDYFSVAVTEITVVVNEDGEVIREIDG